MPPVGEPARASDWNSATLYSGWLGLRPVGAPEQYLASTGYVLVSNMQARLQAATFGDRMAYRTEGPAGAPNTDFGPVAQNRVWDANTNAALWRYVAEKAKPGLRTGVFNTGLFDSAAPVAGDFTNVSLLYLDAIEQVARDRAVNRLALTAAAWVAFRPTMSLQDFVTGAIWLPPASSVVFPPYNQRPPLPNSPNVERWLLSWPASQPDPSLVAAEGRLPEQAHGGGGGGATFEPHAGGNQNLSTVVPWREIALVSGIGAELLGLGALGLYASRVMRTRQRAK